MSSRDDLIMVAIAAAGAAIMGAFWAIKGFDCKVKIRKDGAPKEARVKIRFRKPAETAEAVEKLWGAAAKILGVPVSAIISVSQLNPPPKPA